ncbi:MAG: hypothetical protein IT436_18365 [Phycisphaerales bacterium]|nr:hypothetical protein [Phycisphaerales bacterium]
MPVKITKEQRVYAAILGVAAIGLAADRLVLSSPLTGPAGAAAGEAPPDPAAPAAPAALASEVSAPSDLAQRLEALRGQAVTDEAMANVLSIPAQWFEGESTVAGTEPVQKEPPKPVREYKLTAVAAGKARGEGFAVVNKRRLSIGESIDGMKLIEIRGRQAIFQAGSEKVVLTMDLPMKETRPEPGDHGPQG